MSGALVQCASFIKLCANVSVSQNQSKKKNSNPARFTKASVTLVFFVQVYADEGQSAKNYQVISQVQLIYKSRFKTATKLKLRAHEELKVRIKQKRVPPKHTCIESSTNAAQPLQDVIWNRYLQTSSFYWVPLLLS